MQDEHLAQEFVLVGLLDVDGGSHVHDVLVLPDDPVIPAAVGDQPDPEVLATPEAGPELEADCNKNRKWISIQHVVAAVFPALTENTKEFMYLTNS